MKKKEKNTRWEKELEGFGYKQDSSNKGSRAGKNKRKKQRWAPPRGKAGRTRE